MNGINYEVFYSEISSILMILETNYPHWVPVLKYFQAMFVSEGKDHVLSTHTVTEMHK